MVMVPERRGSRGALLAVLALLVGCSGSDEPLATWGDESVTADEYMRELDYFVEPGQSLADYGNTPEDFLRRVVRFRLVVDSARRSVPALAPSDQGRLDLFREALLRDAICDQAFPEPPLFEEAIIRERYEDRAREEREVQHLRTLDPAVAADAQAALLAGEAFPDMVRRLREEHPDEVTGGSFGFVTKGYLPPAWEAVVWSLEEGEVSELLKTPEGTNIFRCGGIRMTPYEPERALILEELNDAERRRRLADMEANLLQQAGFAPDSTTIELVIDRFTAHVDSLRQQGVETGPIGMPAFSEEERSLPFFTVAGEPFTVSSLTIELSTLSVNRWPTGQEAEVMHSLARRRAFSSVLGSVAAQQGLHQRPDIQERMNRKQDELFMNTLLREIWRGLEPTEEEMREILVNSGQAIPGEVGLREMMERLANQRQAEALDAYISRLEEQQAITYYFDRLPEVMERFWATREN